MFECFVFCVSVILFIIAVLLFWFLYFDFDVIGLCVFNYSNWFSYCYSVTGSEPPPRRHLLDIERSDLKENFKIVRESWLSCKVAVIDGKRAADRSWKQVWAILRGPYFTMQKDKQTEHIIDIRR